MKIKTKRLIIRDFERKDAKNILNISKEKNIARFMCDWSKNMNSAEDYYGFIDYIQTQNPVGKNANKRFAVVLPENDEMIGMVGFGFEETLNETEIAYFMSEKSQRKGYMLDAVNTMIKWYFQMFDTKYLIATIDSANEASNKFILKCGFELFEKRMPMGHFQPNMESDSYFYYRKYRDEN